MTTPEWPVLRRYDADHSLRIALPLGGIGTGTVSLGGRGDLRDWEIRNQPAKGFAPRDSFFVVRAGDAVRALEGPIDPVLYEGWEGAAVPNHSLPRFARSEFLAAYPLAQVLLDDPAVPVTVRLQAFNPLVPADVDASSLPVAVLRYVVTNTGREPLDVTVAGSVRNPGDQPRNERRGDGVLLRSGGDADGERWGSIALAVLDEDDVTMRTTWAGSSWGGPLLDFWDDLSADGRLDERPADGEPVASVAALRRLAPGGTHAFTFLLAWHFPNRRDWRGETVIGNHYATRYDDAWDVVDAVAPQLAELEGRTVAFVGALTGSDLPAAIVEAALSNVSTLRSPTCFRTPDGRFYGWEGCHDDSGSCYGNCTHVWNYEHTTPYLFGELARSMRELEFLHATADDGHMSFRLDLPLDRSREHGVAAADGQMGCLVKLHREWRLSGDDDLLRALWPAARRALEFAWIPGGWDADRDGVMEGSQHNTMDVEYFGPNPQVGGWYLAALRAAEEMARHLGDDEFAATCTGLFARGSAWIDAHLFNGEYYRHEIRPPGSEDAIAPGLRLPGIGARDLTEPELQIGDGCLTDQLVGQHVARLTGLGDLLDAGHVRSTLRSILRHNDRTAPGAPFNPKRSYALAGEPGLLVASYPHGNRPARPFPYFAEVWTGLEYTAAIGLLQAGLVDDGVRVVEAVRSRFDGRRRNPFDEAECGHHYVRAMAAWGLIPALTGFGYDGVSGTLGFAAADLTDGPVTWFWAAGAAWGTVTQAPAGDDGVRVGVAVGGGRLRVATLTVDGIGTAELPGRVLSTGETADATVGGRQMS
ncbi:GH116 family glycosyl-hydrolase [Jiangella rhizosphaerae]|uniref:Glycosyl-hydrolase family 116 catalytic region domain-containing protein n=1 Tax=Jiangella rhizosphaerae TaxID=2293569 RepID=A0A418KTX0_9ACTN|nr:GH116 family glycosyl-hydrolase [Jiangella rhizosphaerae]RIQ31040.1 hypothetical protein DY240_07095 [Jiangella rhizosphaerae]